MSEEQLWFGALKLTFDTLTGILIDLISGCPLNDKSSRVTALGLTCTPLPLTTTAHLQLEECRFTYYVFLLDFMATDQIMRLISANEWGVTTEF